MSYNLCYGLNTKINLLKSKLYELEMKKIERLPSSINYDKEKTEVPGVSLGILEQIFFNLQRRQNTE